MPFGGFHPLRPRRRTRALIPGTDSSHFKPNDPCSRGEVVTFLYRAQSQ